VSFSLPRFVDQSPSRETDSHLLWDQKVHCHIHNSPSLYFVTSFCSAAGYRHLPYAGSTPSVFNQQLSFVVIQLAERLVALCRYQTTLQNEDCGSSCCRQQYTRWVCTRFFFKVTYWILWFNTIYLEIKTQSFTKLCAFIQLCKVLCWWSQFLEWDVVCWP